MTILGLSAVTDVTTREVGPRAVSGRPDIRHGEFPTCVTFCGPGGAATVSGPLRRGGMHPAQSRPSLLLSCTKSSPASPGSTLSWSWLGAPRGLRRRRCRSDPQTARDVSMRFDAGRKEPLSAVARTIGAPPPSFLVDVHDRQANAARHPTSGNRESIAIASVAFRSIWLSIRDGGRSRTSLTCVGSRADPSRGTQWHSGTRRSSELRVGQIRSPAGSRSVSGSGWWPS